MPAIDANAVDHGGGGGSQTPSHARLFLIARGIFLLSCTGFAFLLLN